MKTKSNQSKTDFSQSNRSCLGYSELDHSQLNHSMMVNASSIALGGLMGVTLLSGLILSSSLTSADDAVDVVTITVPTSCSMSSTGTNSHVAELGNGQSNSTIGETTITTYCNDNEGFAIYAIGYTGDTLGNTVLTDTSLGFTHDIVTGTATSGNTSNWAMKLSTISSPSPNFPITIAGSTNDSLKQQGDPDYSTFQAVPDDYAKVAYRTSSTDVGTNAEGSTIKTTYQVYISPTQSAGTYTGKVKYALVRPNTAPAPSNTPTLISTVTCTAQVPGATYMQDINASNKATILAGMTEDAEYFLRDARDNKDYCVAKLKDGNLWMTQNLDHDIDSTKTYTPADTDIANNWTPSLSTYITSTITWIGSSSIPESYDPGDLYVNPDFIEYDASSNGNGERPDATVSDVADSNSHYHLGNYYSWTAAIAMNDSTNYLGSNGTLIEQSICPAGWTLPRVGTGNDTFRSLFDEYGFVYGYSDGASFIDTNNNYHWDLNESAAWTNPLYFVAGSFSTPPNTLSYSSWKYWAPITAGDDDVYQLYLNTSYYEHAYSNANYGDAAAVRCVARPVSSTIEM